MCQSTDLRVATGRDKGEPAGRFVVSSRPKSNDIDYYIEYKRNVVELSERQICHFNKWSDILRTLSARTKPQRKNATLLIRQVGYYIPVERSERRTDEV